MSQKVIRLTVAPSELERYVLASFGDAGVVAMVDSDEIQRCGRALMRAGVLYEEIDWEDIPIVSSNRSDWNRRRRLLNECVDSYAFQHTAIAISNETCSDSLTTNPDLVVALSPSCTLTGLEIGALTGRPTRLADTTAKLQRILDEVQPHSCAVFANSTQLRTVKLDSLLRLLYEVGIPFGILPCEDRTQEMFSILRAVIGPSLLDRHRVVHFSQFADGGSDQRGAHMLLATDQAGRGVLLDILDQDDTALFMIDTHSTPLDMMIGSDWICGLRGAYSVQVDPTRTFSCFQDGKCTRPKRSRRRQLLDPLHLFRCDTALMTGCNLFVSNDDKFYDSRATVLYRMRQALLPANIVVTRGLAIARPDMINLFAHLYCQGTPLGETVTRLNTQVEDATGRADQYLLIGDPAFCRQAPDAIGATRQRREEGMFTVTVPTGTEGRISQIGEARAALANRDEAIFTIDASRNTPMPALSLEFHEGESIVRVSRVGATSESLRVRIHQKGIWPIAYHHLQSVFRRAAGTMLLISELEDARLPGTGKFKLRHLQSSGRELLALTELLLSWFTTPVVHSTAEIKEATRQLDAAVSQFDREIVDLFTKLIMIGRRPAKIWERLCETQSTSDDGPPCYSCGRQTVWYLHSRRQSGDELRETLECKTCLVVQDRAVGSGLYKITDHRITTGSSGENLKIAFGSQVRHAAFSAAVDGGARFGITSVSSRQSVFGYEGPIADIDAQFELPRSASQGVYPVAVLICADAGIDVLTIHVAHS